MKRHVFFTVAMVAIHASAALAGDLKAPFELESSQVLPKGVRNPRIKNLFMSVDGKYDGSGAAQPLGQKLNKFVTWQDLLDAQADAYQRAEVQGMIDASGASAGAGPGSTSGVVNTFANVKVPVIAVGINDKLTLAAALPIMDVEVKTDLGFVRNGYGEQFVEGATRNSPSKGDEAAFKLNNAVNQKLARLGYETIPSRMKVSGVGDAKLVAKYNYRTTEVDSIAFKADVTMPTGIAPNADRALDVPTGDGQWDVGAAVIYDRRLTSSLRWNSYGAYVVQLPDSLDRRLPVSATDSLSADKERVSRNLGDQLQAGTSLSYYFPGAGVTVGAGYSFQHQAQTSYRGRLFAPERYRWLEAETPWQELHAATATAGFSTVDFYKQKKFVYPFQANVSYSKPLVGRNVTTNDVVAAELVLFF